MRRKTQTSALARVSESVHFVPKGPWEKGRKSLTMLVVERRPDGKKVSKSHITPEMLDLQARLRARAITVDQARAEMETIRTQLYAAIKNRREADLNSTNTDLARAFVRDVVQVKVNILPSSVKSQEDGTWQLVKLFGRTNFATASTNEIQRRIDAVEKGGTYKKLFMQAKALLKYIHRYADADALKPKHIVVKEPPYLTIEQVHTLVEAIPDSTLALYPLMREFILIVFNLGLRISEALALEKGCVMKQDGTVIVRISKQYARAEGADRNGERLRTTKNKREREVVPINLKETLDCLAKWLSAYPTPESREKYRTRASKLVASLCTKLFKVKEPEVKADGEAFFFDNASIPNAEDLREYGAIHMLRASHAKYVVEVSGNEVFAANQIGDNPEVMRRHYSGRKNSPQVMGAMSSLLEKQNKGS